MNHIFNRYIGRLRSSLSAQNEEGFVYALVDILKSYKVFDFLKGEAGPAGPPGPAGPTGSSNRAWTIIPAPGRPVTTEDGTRILALNSTVGNVDMQINPTVLEGIVLIFHRSDNSGNSVTLTPTSGHIKLRNYDDVNSLPVTYRDTKTLVSDGTNFIEIHL
jgi:hypothetical protein